MATSFVLNSGVAFVHRLNNGLASVAFLAHNNRILVGKFAYADPIFGFHVALG